MCDLRKFVTSLTMMSDSACRVSKTWYLSWASDKVCASLAFVCVSGHLRYHGGNLGDRHVAGLEAQVSRVKRWPRRCGVALESVSSDSRKALTLDVLADELAGRR